MSAARARWRMAGRRAALLAASVFTVLVLLPPLVSCSGGGGDKKDGTVPATTPAPSAGFYTSAQSVTLAADEPATIYYSVDGVMPSVGGASTFSGASPVSGIQVSGDTTLLQYFAVDSAGNREPVRSATYVVSTGAATGPGDTQDHLPLEVGDSWTSLVTQAGSSAAVTHSRSITGTAAMNGVTALVSRGSTEGSLTELQEYLLKNGRGVTYLGNDDQADPWTPRLVPYPLAIFPLQAGASFVQVDRSLDAGEDLDHDGKSEALHVRAVVTVQEPESVTVPAGTFEHSIRMRTESTITVTLSRDGRNIAVSTLQTQWLAPGVGPVKSVTSMTAEDGLVTSETEELTSAMLLDHLLGPPAEFPAGSFPTFVAVGDVDGDGRPDVVVADQGDPSLGFADAGVSVLLGDGTGSFGPARTFSTGTYSSAVAIADLNADGRQDLAVANYGGPSVSVLLGKGDGTFGAAVDHGLPGQKNPTSLVVGDFNGDSKPDLAVALGYGGNATPGSVAILLGNGDGTFGAATEFGVGGGPVSVATGDLDRDGKLDLAVANTFDGTVSVLFGNGAGSFGNRLDLNVTDRPVSVTIADFDRDGNPDLAVANDSYMTNDANVSILLGTGTRSFGAPRRFFVDRMLGAYLHSLACGDLDGDGVLDLAVAKEGTGWGGGGRGPNVSILLGDGSGAFSPVVRFAPLSEAPESVAVADLDGDGKPDVAVASRGGVSVLLNARP